MSFITVDMMRMSGAMSRVTPRFIRSMPRLRPAVTQQRHVRCKHSHNGNGNGNGSGHGNGNGNGNGAHGYASSQSNANYVSDSYVVPVTSTNGNHAHVASMDFVKELESLEPAELADTLWAYNLMRPYDPVLYENVASYVAGKLEAFDDQLLINILCALSDAGHSSPNLLMGVTPQLSKAAATLPTSTLVNLVWAQALVHEGSPELLDALDSAAAAKLSEFSADDLAKLLAGFAELQVRPIKVCEAGAAVLLGQKLHGASPQSLTYMVWAMARLDNYDRALFDAAAQEIAPRVSSFTPQMLTQLAWAYAHVRDGDDVHRRLADVSLLRALVGRCNSDLSSFSARQCVDLVWALACLPHYDEALYNNVSAALVARGDKLGPQDVTIAAWSFGRVQHKSAALFEVLSTVALSCFNEFSGEDLVLLLAAYPQASAYSEPLFKAVAGSALHSPAFFGSAPLLELVRALGAVQHHDPTFFASVQDHILARLSSASRSAASTTGSSDDGEAGPPPPRYGYSS